MDSSNLQQELRDIESTISKLEKDIKLGEALDRLKKTPDYQLVITEGYIDSESKKLFDILVEPAGTSCYSNEQVLTKLASISDFKSYVGSNTHPGTIAMAAESAPDNIDRERLYRKEITAKNSQLDDGEV
jgi:hypothetical protein